MLTNTLILLLIALSGIDATCKCYAPQSSIVKGTNVKISNAYDDDTYIACYMNTCGFIADSGTASVGWTNATVQFSIGSDPSGILTFYDGTNDGPNNVVIASVSASDSLNGATTVPLYSSTSSIYVKYSQDDPKKPNQYYGTLIANSGLALPTTTVAPTTVPTTRYFQDSLYPRDPWQISHDLLILINPKTDLGDTGLNALNNLTTQLVTLLNNTSGSSKTRLGFATLTPYFPNYAAQGEIWKMTSNDVLSALPKAGVTSNVSVVNALKQVVPTFFNVATDNNPAPTRLNAQRSVIVFTAGWLDEDLDDTDTNKIFSTYGVNLAVIGYKTNSTKLTVKDWYNYVSLDDTTPQDVANFVNRYYLNSDYKNTLTNNWCKPGADPVYDDTGVLNTIQEPRDYNGPQTQMDQWKSTNGQSERYCNFQDTTYTYNRKQTTKLVKVTVFYELEVEKDFLKFFADGVEVESFTGIDVNSSNFIVDATVIQAKFTTDNSGVYRGFKAIFDEVDS